LAIRVLIVDDSLVVQQLLREMLSPFPDLKVVGTASDPFVARDKIKQLRPDVLTLDIEMPRMNGLDFLEKLMRLRPMPVVIVSSLTQRDAEITLRALERGAVDYIAKPKVVSPQGLADYAEDLAGKIRAAADTDVGYIGSLDRTWLSRDRVVPVAALADPQAVRRKIVLIGGSTGATEAIREVLVQFPDEMPPILIVQHMPEVFTGLFARRLDQTCRIKVTEARHDELAEMGHAYVAPGHSHLEFTRTPQGYRLKLNQSEPVNRHRPSVDVLFNAGAKVAGEHAIGIILTGMGADGAAGLLALKTAGAYTIAQDQKTSVIFGMPRAAIGLGAAIEVLPLKQISDRLLAHLNAASPGSSAANPP
jgi:two-component system, chemotaxis family, protein-glutamate methylesterase/glutaminase